MIRKALRKATGKKRAARKAPASDVKQVKRLTPKKAAAKQTVASSRKKAKKPAPKKAAPKKAAPKKAAAKKVKKPADTKAKKLAAKKVRDAAAKKAKEVAAKEGPVPEKLYRYPGEGMRGKSGRLTQRDIVGQVKRGVPQTVANKRAEERAAKRLAIELPMRTWNKENAEDILTIQIFNSDKNISKTEARKLAKAMIKDSERQVEISEEFRGVLSPFSARRQPDKGFRDVSDKTLKDESSKKSGGRVYKRKKGGKVMSGQDFVNSFYD